MDKRSEYIEKARENLELINARIVELEAMANKKSGEAKRELDSTLSGIREYRDKAEQRLEDLRRASKPAWEDMKHGAEQAWNSLSVAVDRARERFQ